MSSFLEKFGERLKYLRERRGLTQEMLAEAVGLQPRQINYLERGKKWTRAETLEKLAQALKVPVKDLFDF